MSDETSPITATLKGGAGYEAPWLVFRGDNPEQVTQMLRNVGELFEATVEAANMFRGVTTAGPLLANAEPAQAPQQNVTPGPWPNSQQATQPGWSQPQQQTAPTPQQPSIQLHPTDVCQSCGARPQYKAVFRKSDNKKFEFWTCPNQRARDDGHYSEFYNG